MEAILKLEGAVSVGHRLGVVTVFVKDTTSPEILDSIRLLLNQYSIYIFDILLVSGIRDLLYSCRVGAKISNAKTYGTVGAFAEGSKNYSSKKYLLLSRHVAIHVFGSEVVDLAGYKINFNERNIHKCEKHVHDIAAFLINEDIEEKYHFDGRFMTEDGKHKPCRVPCFSSSGNGKENESQEIDALVGAEVYIRGASTDLGKGKVVSVDMFDSSKIPIILVEDRERGTPFCQPGDSGAIVCYDDADERYIDALAMVQGQYSPCLNADGKSNVTRYSVITLNECLTDLSSQLGRLSLYDKQFGQM